jgi:hypothetical protein
MTLRLNGSTSGYVEIDAPAVAGDNTLALPSTPNGSLVALDSSGRLGIGTTSPVSSLHISGTGATYTRYVNTTNTSQSLDVGSNSGGASFVFENGNYPLLFGTNAIERARIDADGRLLVGTASSIDSASKLQVKDGYINIYHADSAVNSGYGVNFSSNGGATGRTHARIALAQTAGNGGTLTFSTTPDGLSSPTERMRIIQQGHIKISDNGTYNLATNNYHEIRQTSANTLLYCTNTYNFGSLTGNYGQVIDFQGHSPDNNSSTFFACKDTTANRMLVYSDGDVWTSDAGTLTSDVTLKRDITDASPKLADVMNLRVRNFYWEQDYHPNKQDKKLIGFIAQEFEEVFPALVSEHRIKGGEPIIDENGNNTGETTPEVFKKGIKEAKLVPILVKALQEAVERIETLEAKVAALEVTP